MDNSENSGDVSGLGESFLSQSSNQYVVDGGHDSGSGDETGGAAGGDGEPLREQDRFLPIANVARIMKKSIPRSGKIAKDAKECVQECVSEFISFITSEASERCHQEKRKTINGEDILFAMSNLGFDNYVEPLKVYLQKYRETLHQSQTKMEKGVLDAGSSLEELTAAEAAFGTTVTLTGDILEPSGQQVVYTAAYTDSGQMTLQ